MRKTKNPSQEAHDSSFLPDLVRLQRVELNNNPVKQNKAVKTYSGLKYAALSFEMYILMINYHFLWLISLRAQFNLGKETESLVLSLLMHTVFLSILFIQSCLQRTKTAEYVYIKYNNLFKSMFWHTHLFFYNMFFFKIGLSQTHYKQWTIEVVKARSWDQTVPAELKQGHNCVCSRNLSW